MYKIQNITAKKIVDSHKNYTVEISMRVNDVQVMASVPGGISKGTYEVVSVDVERAVVNIAKITPILVSRSFNSQKEFDNFLIKLDGTSNKGNLGGNVILCLSLCFCRAGALIPQKPLYSYISDLQKLPEKQNFFIPRLMFLIFEGGKHGSSTVSIQEFMCIVPSFVSGYTIYTNAKKYLQASHLSTQIGAEGAFTSLGLDNLIILDILKRITKFPIALDIAETSSTELPKYDELIHRYNIQSIEDPYKEEEWDKWVEFNASYGNKLLVVGDDLIVTNKTRIQKAYELKACNACIIKPNQIGTVTETLEAVQTARDSGFKVIVSHRGSETSDSFIADLAVGIGAEYVKFGAPSQPERMAKYTRLREIEKELGLANKN